MINHELKVIMSLKGNHEFKGKVVSKKTSINFLYINPGPLKDESKGCYCERKSEMFGFDPNIRTSCSS